MVDDQILALANNLGLERVVSFDNDDDQCVPGALHFAHSVLRSAKLLDLAGVARRLSNMPSGSTLAVIVDATFIVSHGVSGGLLPLQTWKIMLKSAGFDVVADLALEATAYQSGVPDCWLEQYWREADLFRQAYLGSKHRLIVCRRNDIGINPTDLSEHIDAMLDVGFLRAKHDKHAAAFAQPIILNIHQIQDYLNLRPIMEVMDPQQTIPLIREHAEFKLMKRLAVVNDLERHGFRPRLYRDIQDLDWNELAEKPLLSATESAITPGHALSRHVVEAAKSVGSPTFLLQHGAWVETFLSGPVSFGSQAILAWGSEHAQSFSTSERSAFGNMLPRGATSANRFKTVGSPKFADMLWPCDQRVLQTRLGLPVENFSGVTLVGTNLHWPRHTDKTSLVKAVQRLSEAKRDELFIIKTHPAESFYDYEALRTDNVVIYDDVLALAIDFHTPRLLNGVDRVMSSLSSLLIDASVLGKPVTQYDTGNTIRYAGIEPLPCDTLESIFDEGGLEKAVASSRALAATYADGNHEQFYASFAELLSETRSNLNWQQDGLENLSAYGLLAQGILPKQRADLRIADLRDLLTGMMFDPGYYESTIEGCGLSTPVEHFLTQGGWTGLNPRVSFDSRWYLAQHPELEDSGLIPVLHYIRVGAKLGYDPHILFDTSWYLKQVGDIPTSMTPLEHYLIQGEAAGMTCHPMFDPAFYAQSLGQPIVGSLLEHFLTTSNDALADPSPSFSCSRYLRRWPDVRAAQINPLLHYLQAGWAERRERSDLQKHLR